MSASFSWKISRSQTPSTSWEPHETSLVAEDKLTPERFWKWVDMCKDDDDFGILEDGSHTHDTADQQSNHANHQYHFELDPACVFDREEHLGKGSLGSVSKMKIRASDIVFACKTSTTRNNVQRLRKEARTLLILDHEHIVQFIGTFTPPKKKWYLSLIMCPVGEQNLEDFLRSPKTLEQKTWLRGWILCLASALCYLHSKGVRHEDIKPSNIIHQGDKVLFTDFGSSTEFRPEITTSTDSPAYGTPRYQAPEVHDKEQVHGARSDIFPLGCVYVEILTAMAGGDVHDLHIFCEEQSAKTKQPSGPFLYSSVVGFLDSWFADLRPPVEITIIWKDIVQLMLREDRKERPTAIQILQLLQAGFIPLVLTNSRNCCNQKCLEHIISEDLPPISNPGQIMRQTWHSTKRTDSVDENIHRLEQLHLLLRLGVSAATHDLQIITSSAEFMENCLVNAFGSQPSSSDGKDFLQVMLHYRMNIHASGREFMTHQAFWNIVERSSEQLGSPLPIILPYPASSMLQAAAWWGHDDSVRILLENGADPNAWNEDVGTALHAAVWRGHAPIVKALLEAGADPGLDCARFDTCLYAAASQGHISVVQTLIDAGSDVNQKPKYSAVPITAAVRNGHSRVVRLLLSVNNDHNSNQHRELSFSLITAADRGHGEIVQDLLHAGADPNREASRWAQTPLIRAAAMGKTSVIRLLYEAGAELNARSGWVGETALIAACRKGKLESVRMLIQLGADVNITGVQGTAHAVASKNGDQDIVQLLEEAGARSTA